MIIQGALWHSPESIFTRSAQDHSMCWAIILLKLLLHIPGANELTWWVKPGCIHHIQEAFDIAWWRHQVETFSASLSFCAKISPVTGEFPAQRPVKRGFDVFFDLGLHQQLSKQCRCQWFGTPWYSLWRHRQCYAPMSFGWLIFQMWLNNFSARRTHTVRWMQRKILVSIFWKYELYISQCNVVLNKLHNCAFDMITTL